MRKEGIDPYVEVEPVKALATDATPSPEPIVEAPPVNRTTPELIYAPIDDNLTEQQKIRDKNTTILYSQYVVSHKYKRDFAKRAKEIIFIFCIIWVTALLAVCATLSICVVTKAGRSTDDVVALVGALLPLIAVIIGTLNIVAKHVFPEGEDQNITDIVKQIHENDLKNKQENMKNI